PDPRWPGVVVGQAAHAEPGPLSAAARAGHAVCFGPDRWRCTHGHWHRRAGGQRPRPRPGPAVSNEWAVGVCLDSRAVRGTGVGADAGGATSGNLEQLAIAFTLFLNSQPSPYPSPCQGEGSTSGASAGEGNDRGKPN